MNSRILNKLAALANELDNKGFYLESDQVSDVMMEILAAMDVTDESYWEAQKKELPEDLLESQEKIQVKMPSVKRLMLDDVDLPIGTVISTILSDASRPDGFYRNYANKAGMIIGFAKEDIDDMLYRAKTFGEIAEEDEQLAKSYFEMLMRFQQEKEKEHSWGRSFK